MNIKSLQDRNKVIIVLYLLGKKFDYAWNIHRNFKKAIVQKKWNKKALKVNSYLTNSSKLSTLLNELERDDILWGGDFAEHQDRKYFWINPGIFLNNDILSSNSIRELATQFHLTIEDMGRYFGNQLMNFYNISHYKFEDRKGIEVISELNRWMEFDFYTILFSFYLDLQSYQSSVIQKLKQKISHSSEISSNDSEKLLKEDDNMSYHLSELGFMMNYIHIYLDLIILSKYRDDLNYFTNNPLRKGAIFESIDENQRKIAPNLQIREARSISRSSRDLPPIETLPQEHKTQHETENDPRLTDPTYLQELLTNWEIDRAFIYLLEDATVLSLSNATLNQLVNLGIPAPIAEEIMELVEEARNYLLS